MRPTRAAAIAFYHELKGFRKVIKQLYGRKSVYYRALNLYRTRSTPEEQPEPNTPEAEVQPSPTPSAAPEATEEAVA